MEDVKDLQSSEWSMYDFIRIEAFCCKSHGI